MISKQLINDCGIGVSMSEIHIWWTYIENEWMISNEIQEKYWKNVLQLVLVLILYDFVIRQGYDYYGSFLYDVFLKI